MADKLIKELPTISGNILNPSDLIPVCMPLDGALKSITVEELLQSVNMQCQTLNNMCLCLANRLKVANLSSANNVIIQQFYGGSGGSVSHSFIELYNPTDRTIELTGMSLHYCVANSSINSIEKILLHGSVPAKTSFLIKGAAANPATPTDKAGVLDITNLQADQTIENAFSNKMIGFILTSNTNTITIEQLKNVSSINGLIDAVSTTDNKGGIPPFVMGSPVEDQSKQKAIRRILFSKTNNNKYDFEKVDYRLAANFSKSPNSKASGPWE